MYSYLQFSHNVTKFLNLSFTVYYIGTKNNNYMQGSFNKTLQAQFTGVAIVLIDVSLNLTKLFFLFVLFANIGDLARKKNKCPLALTVNKFPRGFFNHARLTDSRENRGPVNKLYSALFNNCLEELRNTLFLYRAHQFKSRYECAGSSFCRLQFKIFWKKKQ